MTPEQYDVIKHEARERRARRDRLRTELENAVETYRRSRSDADGEIVASLTSRLRLAEIALEGAEQDLKAAQPFAPVALTDSRETCRTAIDQIQQRRAYRRRTLERQIQQAREGFRSGTPEEHIKIHLRNLQLDPPGRDYQREEDRDAELIAHYEAQLAEHDRRERAQTQTDEPAADVA